MSADDTRATVQFEILDRLAAQCGQVLTPDLVELLAVEIGAAGALAELAEAPAPAPVAVAEWDVTNEELDDIADETPWRGSPRHFGRNVARAAIAIDCRRRAPMLPAEGEVTQLVATLRRLAPQNPLGTADPFITRAADLLEQRHPVPVSERPWAREGWCDEAGRCWFGAPQDGAADAGWILRKPLERLSHQTVSLPATALPLPSGGAA